MKDELTLEEFKHMNEEAKALRIQWMTEYHLTEEEMAESLIYDPPSDVQKEQEELDAVRHCATIDFSWLKDLHKEIYKENGLPEDTTGRIICIACRKLVWFDEKGLAYCNCHAEGIELL
jgi:hypothetical protein